MILKNEVPCPNCNIGLKPKSKMVTCPYCGSKSRFVEDMRELFFVDA